jgi:CHAT domain-containing protein
MSMKLKSLILFIVLTIFSTNIFSQLSGELKYYNQEFYRSCSEANYNGIINYGTKILDIYNANYLIIDSAYYLNIVANLSIAYNDLQLYNKADSLYSSLKDCNFCKTENNVQAYVIILDEICKMKSEQGKNDEAIEISDNALKLFKNSKKTVPNIYYNLSMTRASIFSSVGDFKKAENTYIDAINYAKISNADSLSISTLYSMISDIYIEIDNYSLAEKNLHFALKYITDKNKSTLLYCGILVKLSNIYFTNNDRNNAISFSKENLKYSSLLGETKYEINALLHIASVYSKYNIIDSSMKYSEKASTKAIGYYGLKSPYLISIYNGLGLIHEAFGVNEALKYYLKGIEISEYYKEYFDDMELVYSNAGRCLMKQSINSTSELGLKYYLKGLKIIKDKIGSNNEKYIFQLSMLGDAYFLNNEYDSAITVLSEAVKLLDLNYFSNYQLYISSYQTLANSYENKNKNEEASYYWEKYLEFIKNGLIRNFSNRITNFEKNDILNSRFENYFNRYINNSYLKSQKLINVFNNALYLKNLQLISLTELNKYCNENSTLKLLLKEYNYLINKSNNQVERVRLSEIENIIFNSLPILNRLKENNKNSFNNIKSKLNKAEIAIEIIKFKQVYDVKNNLEDYKYYALLVNKDSASPIAVELFFENDLKKFIANFKSDYRALYSYDRNRESIFNIIFKPIVPYLKSINTIYFSSTGLLNSININAIQLEEDSILLADKFHIRLMNSLEDLIFEKNNVINGIKKFKLYGGIDYGKNNMTPNLRTRGVEKNNIKKRSGIDSWNYLKGTLFEVTQISQILANNKFESEIFKGNFATEKIFSTYSEINDTFLLHVATHGYFINRRIDSIESENPLELTGLIFANGNRNWDVNQLGTANFEDGILTGLELARLNLSKCRIAILSACETGVGKIINNEGVFGLQRSLKLAGVEKCIISLWKVPDLQTAELFKYFYLNLALGDSFDIALKKAQNEIRKKYSSPYFWAGFVLLE